MTKIYKENFVLHNAVTTTGNGEAMYVGNSNIVCLQINGTSTNFELVFEASLDNINFGKYYAEYKFGEFVDTANNFMLTLPQLLYFDVRPVKYLRVKINSIANGNMSILGFDSV